MRSILVLTSTYPRWHGDTEPAFVHLLNRQLARGFSITVLAPHYPGARRHEHMDGIEIYRFRYFFPAGERLAYDGGIITNIRKNRFKLLLAPLFVLSQLISTLALCRKHDFSLIHAHGVIPQGVVALLARRLLRSRIPVIATSHGGDLFSLQQGLLQSLKRYVFRHADMTTVVSEAMRQQLRAMGCAVDTVSVQSMGVDLQDTFVPEPVTTRNRDLVFVGRLVEKKGVGTLIQALQILSQDYPELSLCVVGDGPDRPALEKLAQSLGVAGRVEFTGPVPNTGVPDYYRSARIAVVPSIVAADGDQEGLGLVAVEALGCGCATIVSDLPALRDVITDGDN
ncbi:MAG: glycosyltransferase, partial [Thiohalobacterales bacterium]|nr:glycosyltransferase [Thiohalobacterales bacterium]